jgi:Na+/H+ antiporter NhaD/arsenite permease-like protein
MIRPAPCANRDRRRNAHIIVFFIFLVSNIGGALTPLGDPPLFLGYLLGVDFFWPLLNLWAPTAVVASILLALFLLIDTYYYLREGHLKRNPTSDIPFGVDGKFNLLLISVLVVVVLVSGSISSHGVFHVLSVEWSVKELLRDGIVLFILVVSAWLTPTCIHRTNGFDWRPALEAAELFGGVFVTVIPVIAILRAGSDGALAPLLALLSGSDGQPHNFRYFWIAGGLSSLLDNAPTYLVLFQTAGRQANELMRQNAGTLAAISAGSVFIGAATYIRNAPNFMVRAIAVQNGVNMPSFLGYLVWTFAIIIPFLLLVSCLFFRRTLYVRVR